MSGEILREVLFDTETTGLSHKTGDRIVEIACVEVENLMPTGRTYHAYVNPEREVPIGAFNVHGLDYAFLRNYPKFAQVADSFLDFVGDAQLVAHNASFDMGFMDAELIRMGRPPLTNRFVDTLALARTKFPGAGKITLDALCRRFGIDLSTRTKHAALLDTQLLGRVYLELRGGRHHSLSFSHGSDNHAAERDMPLLVRPSRLIGLPSAEEIERHASFLKGLKSPSIWAASPEPGPAPRM